MSREPVIVNRGERTDPGLAVGASAYQRWVSAASLPPVSGRDLSAHPPPRNGQVIGHDVSVCEAAFVPQGRTAEFQCVVTFVCGGGQVAGQGLINIANPASFIGRLAVTGGTGIYQKARGQGTIHQTS